jgi:biopolymer transport protein ExbD
LGGQGRQEDNTPMMAEMNITPLLDVLLVLVVMFLVMVRPATHAVNLNLCVNDDTGYVEPGSLCHGYEKPGRMQKPALGEVVNAGVSAGGALSADGVLVDAPRLDRVLTKVGGMAPNECQPPVFVNPESDADYKTVIGLLATAQRDGASKIYLPQGRPDFQKPVQCEARPNFFTMF